MAQGAFGGVRVTVDDGFMGGNGYAIITNWVSHEGELSTTEC